MSKNICIFIWEIWVKKDYPGFVKWFKKKSDEIAYVCESESQELLAFLYLKQEGADENYSDIAPRFEKMRRLKIGTFKVALNGFKLGERFLKIIFDNALQISAGQIYVTIFNNTAERERLIHLLQDWGFVHHGVKNSSAGAEDVYTRDFTAQVNIAEPALSYPYFSKQKRKYIVPIYPEYHTELFPDSILRTESPQNYVENRPNRNAIRKVYISRSINRDLNTGDILVFYRTAFNGPAYYTSVATTIGIVENVVDNVPDLPSFISLCRKRSVFSDSELAKHWNYKKSNRPFIVNFLYVYTLPKKLNLKELMERAIIHEAPRGFEQLSGEGFGKLLEGSDANQSLVVD